MNNQAQSAIAVLASTLVFGAAGLWVAPKEPKAAAVGALAGAAGALGYVQQSNRLRQLAAQQGQLLSRTTTSAQRQTIPGRQSQVDQTTTALAEFSKITADHEEKILAIERILRPQAGQAKLSQNEINRIRKRLEDLESQVNFIPTRENSRSTNLQPIELGSIPLSRKQCEEREWEGSPRDDSP